MDFKLSTIRGLAADAATALTRAVQYTEEKLGTSEKTELDEQYELLADRCDKAKMYTEKIVNRTVSMLEPNPNIRIEDYLLEKLDKRQERHRNLEYLGGDMIDAGLEFGAQTIYGSALIKVGQTQQQLGKTEKKFVESSCKGFVRPLRKFLDEDVKTILKERKILEARRLDLDIAKNRIKKAKSLEAQANNKLKPEQIAKEIDQAENDLKIAEEKFERQVEITKLLMEGISSAQANHVRCLSEFVDAQIQFYTKCHEQMIDLQRELALLSTSNATAHHQPSSSSSSSSSTVVAGNTIGKPVEVGQDKNNIANNNNLRSKNKNFVIKSGGPAVTTFSSSVDAMAVSTNQNMLYQQSNSITLDNGIFRADILLSPTDDSTPLSLPENKRRARVLYDYEPQNSQQLKLVANEVLIVSLIGSDDADYVIGERGSQHGKVPLAYLEILN